MAYFYTTHRDAAPHQIGFIIGNKAVFVRVTRLWFWDRLHASELQPLSVSERGQDPIGVPYIGDTDQIPGAYASLTPEQHKWLMQNGGIVVSQLLQKLQTYYAQTLGVGHNKVAVLQRLINAAHASYAPEQESASAYRGRKAVNKALAAVLRDCIREDEFTNDMDDFVRMHLVGRDNSIARKRFHTICNVLNEHSIDIPYQIAACVHIVHDDDTHIVRCNTSTHPRHHPCDETWCNNCVDDDAVTCEDGPPGMLYARDHVYWHERTAAYYTFEEEVEEEEDEEETTIKSYGTNVLRYVSSPSCSASSHTGEFTMGIELEMTSGRGPRAAAACDVQDALGSEYCILKHDGSLPDNGFEIVTAPRMLDEHLKKFKEWAIDPAYRAWDVGSCGMHVHIDSRAFSAYTLGKFLMFVNDKKNADFIRGIAGRHPLRDTQARTYCDIDGGSDAPESATSSPTNALQTKKSDRNRYRMVNVQNMTEREMRRLQVGTYEGSGNDYNTVELRIFRASLKKERLLAQIEFTHALVYFCRTTSYKDLNGATFLKWLPKAPRPYTNLMNWFGLRSPKSAPAADTCTDSVTVAIAA